MPREHNKDFPLNNLGKDYPDEEYVTLRYRQVAFPKYKISQYGTIIGPRGIKIKWKPRAKHSPYPCICASTLGTIIPEGNIAETWAKQVNVNVHTGVAEAFLSFTEKDLPECLQGYNLNQEALDYIKSIMMIDHIDDDKGNPHVDNLRYISAGDNQYVLKERLKPEK